MGFSKNFSIEKCDCCMFQQFRTNKFVMSNYAYFDIIFDISKLMLVFAIVKSF